MMRKVCMLMAVFTLFLGFVAPVWATHTVDPLEESYSQHVLPYYNVGPGFVSLAVFADTSFVDPGATGTQASPGVSNIHLFFFDKPCNLVRDDLVTLTANGVVVLNLNSAALAGIPNEGVIFADTGFFSDGDNERFLAYIILVNLADGTLTRIDSIPFSPSIDGDITKAHWTRYDRFNTIAATVGDSTSTAAGSIRTTLTLFNAVGGAATKAGSQLGTIDTLREFLAHYGYPRVGDWVTTGTSSTSNVTPGIIELDAFDGAENFLGSFRVLPNCFERFRLRDQIPVLASGPASAFLGHVVSFSLADVGRTTNCPASGGSAAGRCAFSGFQETVVQTGAVSLIFSGYFHHSQ